jgi:hypothetical protein
MPGAPFVKFTADIQDFLVEKKIAAILFASEYDLTELEGEPVKLGNAAAFTVLRKGTIASVVKAITDKLIATDAAPDDKDGSLLLGKSEKKA